MMYSAQWQYTALTYSLSYLEPVHWSMFSSNCCLLTCIEVSQEAGQVIWYAHLFQNFPQFIVIHTDSHSALSNFRRMCRTYSLHSVSCGISLQDGKERSEERNKLTYDPEARKEKGAILWKLLPWVIFFYTFWAWAIEITLQGADYSYTMCSDEIRGKMVASFYFSWANSSFKIIL